METGKIFQVSDLANNRTEFIDEARQGLARLRDKDGTSLVMMRESEFSRLQRMEELTGLLLMLEHINHLGRVPSLYELGEHSWLRVFGSEDLKEMSSELSLALIAARGDEDTRAADDCLRAWRLTARQLEDPLRRSALMSQLTSDDLVDAPRPNGEMESGTQEEPGS